MTSSRSSKATTIALLCTLVLALAAPAAAVSVTDKTVPAEGEVGTTIEATYTMEELYQEPSFQSWTLQGASELRNVTWTVAFYNPQGEFVQRQYSGQTFSQAGIDAESGGEFEDTITRVEVTVRGDVPQIEAFTYPEEETFVVAEISQQAGSSGSTNTVGSWSVHQYTTGEDGPGSKQARTAIESAEAAIEEANAAGADTSEANSTLQTAVDFYELGQFEKAVDRANTAEEQANDAASSSQTMQTVLMAGAAVLVIALIAGGVWYYREQQSDYDKLG